jgi:NADH dehydrogenase
MSGRVFVTGGSGFVGSAVIDELLSRNFEVNALVKRKELPIGDGRVRQVKGDLLDRDVLEAGIRGCDAVVHLVGIIMERPSRGVTFDRIHFEGTQSAVDATKAAGVKRYVHMSALGSRFDAVSNYHKTKFRAEEYVRGSGLDWTIFRPSLIHGPRGEFMQMEAAWARKKAPPFLFMPYFGAGICGGGGAGMLQPVFVGDVARAFVDAIENPKAIGEIYPLGGSQRVTWPEMHRISAQAIVGKRRWVKAMPAWYARLVTRVVPGPLLPFNRDQVIMSQEENTCDMTKFRDDFGWETRAFGDVLPTYAGQL